MINKYFIINAMKKTLIILLLIPSLSWGAVTFKNGVRVDETADYFERAAETHIKALQTNKPLRVLNDNVAEKAAQDLEEYPAQAEAHFRDIKEMLNREGSDYKN